MSKLEELIKEFCPNGVECKKLGDVCIVETGGEPPKNSVKGKHPTGEYIYPIFSNGVGENALWGFSDSYRINIPSVTFSSIGTIGCPTLRETAFTPIIRLKVLYPKNNTELDVKFLKYALETVEFKQQKSSVPNINANMIKSIIIPLPALPVQREIVRILDSFTLYSAELTAELTARRKQYEFYRDKLLNFNTSIEETTIGDIALVTKLAGFEFTNYVKYSDFGNVIALRGLNVKNGKLDLTDIKYIDGSDFSKLNRSKLQIGDMLFTYVGTIGQVALIEEDDKYYLAPNVALIRLKRKDIMPKYIRYYFQSNAFFSTQILRLLQSSSMQNIPMEKIRKFVVKIPPIEVQERIVKVLDNFDAICSDLGIGLPAEIEKRQKQYEYYREKLLTFDMNPATIFNGTERNGTERNGTERNGTERNGTERNGTRAD